MRVDISSRWRAMASSIPTVSPKLGPLNRRDASSPANLARFPSSATSSATLIVAVAAPSTIEPKPSRNASDCSTAAISVSFGSRPMPICVAAPCKPPCTRVKASLNSSAFLPASASNTSPSARASSVMSRRPSEPLLSSGISCAPLRPNRSSASFDFSAPSGSALNTSETSERTVSVLRRLPSAFVVATPIAPKVSASSLFPDAASPRFFVSRRTPPDSCSSDTSDSRAANSSPDRASVAMPIFCALLLIESIRSTADLIATAAAVAPAASAAPIATPARLAASVMFPMRSLTVCSARLNSLLNLAVLAARSTVIFIAA